MGLAKANLVTEVQGEQGPFAFSEILLQRLWARGRFDHARMETQDGRRVEILRGGRWNRLAGPDFKGARLRIGTWEGEGDVELHLQASDWEAHGHAGDPAYEAVILHVVLFPPKAGAQTRGGDGRVIPVLSLLSLLPYDLETFALDDAAEGLAGRRYLEAYEALSLLPVEERHQLLRAQALERFHAKVAVARRRVERLGWEGALHHAALDCLGYRLNRGPMLEVASRVPLERWREDEAGLVEQAWRGVGWTPWTTRGVRPGNHPKKRLEQYRSWNRCRSTWTEGWGELPLGDVRGGAGRVRGLRRERERLCEQLTGAQLRGSRFDTFMVDVVIPYAASLQINAIDMHFDGWFDWYAGDQSDGLRRVAFQLGWDPLGMQAYCNGYAQGLLGWCLTKELETISKEPGWRA